MAIILMDAVYELNLLIVSEFLVVVSGLPSSASWQVLKDHMWKAGDVWRALLTTQNYEDMKYAIRKLDDSESQNPFSKAYISVESYHASPHGAGCQNQSRSPSRSPRSNLRSLSKSRSPSPARLSRSRSRSISN
ncbi:hypothetical protein SLA2020_028620 [Shorea laevis]